MLPLSGDIGDQCLKWFKIDRNFACFWPPFLGGLHEFLDLNYKIRPVSDHVAKFHGDQSWDLGESVAQKKTSEANQKPARN